MKKNYETPWFNILNFSPIDNIMTDSTEQDGKDPSEDDLDWQTSW